jgi:integrase/recombinase XerD
MTQFKSVLKDVIVDFLSLRKASKSESTYSHDHHILSLFDKYLCAIDCSDKNLSEAQMNGWITTLTGKSNSIANMVILIRIFLIHLKGYGVHPYIPPIPKSMDDYIPYIFSNNEMTLIFSNADKQILGKHRKNTLIHIEFPMVLRLICGCGLRIGETLALKMKAVDLDIGVLTLKYTKDDKQRLVPMHSSLTKILKQYCMAMGIIGYPEAYLFPSTDLMEPVTVANAQHKFSSILEQCNIRLPGRKKHQRGPCIHCLRHVFTFNSFANGEEAGHKIDNYTPFLSIYLGHDSLNETEKYLKFSSEMFPDAMKLFDDYTSEVFPEVNFDE